MDLNTSSFLFEQLGGEVGITMQNNILDADVKFIDSNVRVVGVKTGVMIDIPVRFLRK